MFHDQLIHRIRHFDLSKHPRPPEKSAFSRLSLSPHDPGNFHTPVRSAPPEAGIAREKQEDCAVARSSVCLRGSSGRDKKRF